MKLVEGTSEKNPGWIVAGFDTSSSSLAGAAIGWDRTCRQLKGPVFVEKRWTKENHYFDRLRDCARSHEMILDLQAQMGVSMSPNEIFIAQEEPWPLGMVAGKLSNALKQQAEISGAFLGGLVRYGYTNVAQINSMRWRSMVAKALGITTHSSKWKDPALCAIYNCKPDATGKFRTKQWALETFGSAAVPDWPDIISRRGGRVPRPEGSVAKAVQPDDRYDALAVCWVFCTELSEGTLRDGILEAVQPALPNEKGSRVKRALKLV